jgi:hypothetical protein
MKDGGTLALTGFQANRAIWDAIVPQRPKMMHTTNTDGFGIQQRVQTHSSLNISKPLSF